MNILTVIGIVLLLIFIIAFVAMGLSRDPSPLIIGIVFASLLIAPVPLSFGIVQSAHHRHAQEAIFTKASESVFFNIKGAAEGYSALSSGDYGSITLADPSTVLITVKDPMPTSPSNVPSASHDFKKSLIVAVNLPDSTYTLQGSLASDAKGWCFGIQNGKNKAVYNQNGFVGDNINGNDFTRALCSHGFAYDYAGHAIVGTVNPN